ncbi:MAG: HEAT repeat domain-containing protein, partial [Anaerolineae bacterium]|nr:HEAT repeat domain-containing protein [Anaerolineae bacterium]
LKERYGQPPDRAVKIARVMIDQFRERNFILSLYGANVYGFVHRAFLEYFCATALVYKFEKTQEMTLAQLKQEVYGRHWEDQSWHEVLRLICGMIDEKFAGEIIDYLANEVYRHWPREFGNRPPWHIMLAITCIGEVRNFGLIEPISQKVIERTFELIEHGIFSDLRLQDFINEHILPAILSIEGLFANCPNLAKWMPRIRKFKFEWWYWKSLSNLGIIIGTLGAGLNNVRSALLDFLDEEKKWPPLYLVGLWGIAQGWRNDPLTVSLLRDRAVNDARERVRDAAISALTEHFGDAPQTLPLLNNWAVNAPHGNVRSIAIDALAEYFRDDPQTLLRLRDWAVNASHSEVRAAAVTALARYFREDSQTLSLLRDWVISSPYNEVRSVAVYALARYFRADPQTLPLVRDRVVNDTHEQVRAAAVSTLARHFRADPQALALVRDRAINDAHEKVRSAAVSALAEHFRGDTLTLPLVHDRAIKDAHEEVRFAAVSAMAKNFRNDPQTLPRLRDWAANASHSEVRSAAICNCWRVPFPPTELIAYS